MTITDAYLRRPHNGNGLSQFAHALVSVQRMPFNCLTEFNVQRHLRFEFAVHDARHRAYWNAFLANTLDIDDGRLDNNGQVSDVFVLPDPFLRSDYNETILGIGLYECTPGPGTTGVKLLTAAVATDPRTNTELGKRVFPAIKVKKILPRPC